MDPYSNRPMYPQQTPVTYPPQGQYPPNEPIISVNPAALFGGMQFVYVEDPMLELASCPSLLVRQEPEFF